MRLIVLIRSFNPRRTQFILQDIETRGKSFNPRAHTGRDCSAQQARCGRAVSIHAPTRGATKGQLLFSFDKKFQSTRPHGARHVLIARRYTFSTFQSTRPHGARPGLVRSSACRNKCFNPRAHTGRDLVRIVADLLRRVSIHAPTRGATSTEIATKTSRQFQSTRPHGARHGRKGKFKVVKRGFNPRAHTGRDFLRFCKPVRIGCFNPRAHTGRDCCKQPRMLRPYCFNPRAHTGRDFCAFASLSASVVSIHAPTRGATGRSDNPVKRTEWFQSTRPHGARQYIQQTPEYLYSKLHFLRDMANIHAKLFLLSPTITNYLKLKHCESIAI